MASNFSHGLNQELLVISYNMRGFNTGRHTVRDIVLADAPDIFLLQEHWLTPANLGRFDEDFPQYLCFGSSAMNATVDRGVLRGRPYGGVMTLVSNKLQKITKVICATDRYVVVTVGSTLFVNVYFPCVGLADRLCIYEEVIDNLSVCLNNFPTYKLVIGGDLNTDLDKFCPASSLLGSFMSTYDLHRCDLLFPANRNATFFNDALGIESHIDYFLVSDVCTVSSFNVMDLDVNMSDHRPVSVRCLSTFAATTVDSGRNASHNDSPQPDCVTYLRWDHADLDLYRNITEYYLRLIYGDILELDRGGSVTVDNVDQLYHRVIDILNFASNCAVPKRKKNFFKFWWDNDMNEIKERSIASCRSWKSAGKPRSGPIFEIYKKDKAIYKNTIRKRQREERVCYSNELHEALLKKQGSSFWKCWKSKFETNKSRMGLRSVNGIADDGEIAKQFAQHFASACTNNSSSRAATLKANYTQMRADYCGLPDDPRYRFDAELVESVILKMKRGKAAGLDGITSEHLRFSHCLLSCVLSKLYNFMLRLAHVPHCFGLSYTVPVIKNNTHMHSKTITVDDFRGVSISPVLSKVLEHCILDRYCDFLGTSDNQFGFKRGLSCSHAIFTLRTVVDHYVNYGSTVNVCSLDLSKAFDRMNHHALFIKLMKRNIPVNLLSILELWFSVSMTCVKWGHVYSDYFSLSCGVRQGGVLSPCLFAIFIDSVVDRVRNSGLGCYLKMTCFSILCAINMIL